MVDLRGGPKSGRPERGGSKSGRPESGKPIRMVVLTVVDRRVEDQRILNLRT